MKAPTEFDKKLVSIFAHIADQMVKYATTPRSFHHMDLDAEAIREIKRAVDESMPDIETLTRLFHETYEKNTPQFGYETRKDTKALDVSSPNGRLMVVTVATIRNSILESLGIQHNDNR